MAGIWAKILATNRGVVLFDGRCAHEVARYTGERVSVVWYNLKDSWNMDDELKKELVTLGFRPPKSELAAEPVAWRDWQESASWWRCR